MAEKKNEPNLNQNNKGNGNNTGDKTQSSDSNVLKNIQTGDSKNNSSKNDSSPKSQLGKESNSNDNSKSVNGQSEPKAPRNASDVVKQATSNPEDDKPKGEKGKASKVSDNVKAAKGLATNPKKAGTQMLADKAKERAQNSVVGASPEAVQKTVEMAQKATDLVVKAKSALVTAKGGIALFAATVADPVFWIVVLVILVVIALIVVIVGAVQVIGRTENADGCGVAGDSSSDGIPAKDTGNWIENATSAANWMMSTTFKFTGGKPLTLNQVAGIIGNWSQESNVNPKIVQVGSGLSTDMSNAALMKVSGGGKAVGLAQWDGARRTALAKFAEKQGKHWSEMQVQLEYLKTELDGYEGSGLAAGGFNDASKSAKELVLIFEEKFERAGKPNMENRYKGAEEFLAKYNGSGGYTGDTGGSCLNDSGGDVDASDLVALAVKLSYATSAESRVSSGDSWGKNKAKQEYKDAKKEAQKVGGKDGMTDLYASCDRFVATVIKLTTDKDIPWGSTAEQGTYLKNSSKWKQYTTKGEAKPGDIWITKKRGHVILYLGKVNGRDTIAHASYLSRVAALGDASYLSNNLVDTGGRAYYGYTFVG